MTPEKNEKRSKSRLQHPVNVKVIRDGRPTTARLADLSQAAARIIVARSVGNPGDAVMLALPGADKPVSVAAEILRVAPYRAGQVVVLRFVPASVEQARELRAAVVHVLDGDSLGGDSGEGANEDSGEAKQARGGSPLRIRVACADLSELGAVVENISRGGLSMTVSDQAAIGEDVKVVIPDVAGEDLITVPGKVVREQKLSAQDNAGYRLGIAFESLRSERQRCLEAFLEYLITQE